MTTKSERTAGLVAKVTCIARRTNGQPCSNRPMKGQNVCKNHGGAAPAARRKAAERILMAQDLAAAKLIELMNDPNVPASVQRSAAADLLDRGGNVAAHVLAIPGLGRDEAPWEQVLGLVMGGGNRAESRALRGLPAGTPDTADQDWIREELMIDAPEIVDAEVVEESHTCRGCGAVFPDELPAWLDDYPEFCRPCRDERGLPDPGGDAPTSTTTPPRRTRNGQSPASEHRQGGTAGVGGNAGTPASGQGGTSEMRRSMTHDERRTASKRNRAVAPPVSTRKKR